MSLVNDMLRDLDARRREGAGHGLGAEKLVPAAERPVKRLSLSPGKITAVVLVVILAGLATLLFFMQRQPAGQLPFSVQIPTTASVEQEPSATDNLEAMESELIAQAAAAAAQTVAIEATQTLSQLEARLQQLEAQNQALLEMQQREAELAATIASTSVPATANAGAGASNAMTAEDAWIDSEWANAPALPADDLNSSATTAVTMPAEDLTSPMNRVPREMSLQDRDRQAVQQALQQWSSGQRLQALQTLDRFAYENPEAHGSRETLAKLLIQQGEPERAMQAVELGLSIAPGNNAYKKIKARLDIEQGRAEQALQMLLASPPPVQADTEFHDLMATAFLSTQQYDFATATYQSLLQQNAAEGRWWYGLAASFDARGQSQDAAVAYERALQQVNLSPSLRQASQTRLQLIRQISAAR
jgi:MSHA biogenesis protein MshN